MKVNPARARLVVCSLLQHARQHIALHPSSFFSVVLSLSILAFVTTSAWSDAGPKRDRGIYVGAGAGLGYLNPTDSNAEIKVEEQKDSASQVFLGVDLGHRFGAELAYTNLGTADLSDGASMRYREASVSGLLYGFNSSSNLSRRSGLYGFGRAGVGRLYTSANGVDHNQENDWHLLLGAGAEFGFGNGFSLRGEYTSFDHDAKYLHMSVLYRFFSHYSGAGSLASLSPADTVASGSVDSNDRCADTSHGLKVARAGCPEPTEVLSAAISGVNFVTDSAELLPAAQQVLNAAADTLIRFPDVVVAIKAHTDNRGSANYNQDLSRRRAISVARYLNARGVGKSRLTLQAFGESVPLVSNESVRGRSKNRRVEFTTVTSR